MEWLAEPINLMVNRLLQHDPDASTRLSTLAGKTLCVIVEEWPAPWYVSFSTTDVRLHQSSEAVADATLQGALSAFVAMLLSDTIKSRTLFVREIALHGDMAFAQAVQVLFSQLDIDWEAWLADYLGDVPTHMLSQSVKTVFGYSQQAISAWKADVREYLLDEARWVASPQALNNFYQENAILRDDVARLEQQFAQLKDGKTT